MQLDADPLHHGAMEGSITETAPQDSMTAEEWNLVFSTDEVGTDEVVNYDQAEAELWKHEAAKWKASH